MPKAVVLLSGGMDSATTLAVALQDFPDVETVSIDYNQRHLRELTSAKDVAEFFSVRHTIVDLSLADIFKGASSSQTDAAIEVPEGHYADESMKTTVVPNRNMVLLSIAGAVAISRGAEFLYYGAHAGDHAIYPDCRPQFAQAMAKAFLLCDWKQLHLLTPFMNKTKADIVTIGAQLNVPFGLTYSCYKGELLTHCGKCGTCVERREAFIEAGIPDPTMYEE